MKSTSVAVTWSDFLRDPNAVTDRLADADVVLHRRDAEDLHLSSEARYQAENETFGLLARLFLTLVKDQTLRDRLSRADLASWQQFLPLADRDQFLEEYVATAVACVELGSVAPLARPIREWHMTALMHADPRRARALIRTLAGKT